MSAIKVECVEIKKSVPFISYPSLIVNGEFFTFHFCHGSLKVKRIKAIYF